MSAIGIRDLKANTSQIVRRVREKGETIDVTYHGEVVARLIPIKRARPKKKELAVWTDLEQLAAEIGLAWPADVSAVEAIRDVRR